MKDHPHLRGAAESYNSLKEAFLLLLHLSGMMGGHTISVSTGGSSYALTATE